MTKTQIYEAEGWLLEFEDPDASAKNRRKVGPWFVPPTQFHGSALSASRAYGNISITRGLSAKSNSQSFSNAEENIARVLSSKTYSQSEAIKGSFYFANFLLLEGKALCQSFAGGQETDVTSFKQLKGAAQSESYSGNPCIFYVNFGSAFTSQAYFSESSHSSTLNLQSKTLSQSLAKAQVSQPYKKLILATSKVICGTHSLAEISKSFRLYSTVLASTYSKAAENISKNLNSKSLVSTFSSVNEKVQRALRSNIISSSIGRGHKNIKLNVYSRFYTQTNLRGAEVLSRILASKANTQTHPNTTLSKKINTNSKMIGISYGRGGEVVTRVFSGVAESISIAQKSLGSVHRLFVSSAISPSFSKANIHITTNLYSAFYSQTFVKGCDIIVSRPLGSTAKSPNPFHGVSSKFIKTQGPAAVASLSRANETVNRPLSSTTAGQNPFHANPNLERQLKGEGQSETFAKAQGISQRLNLAGEAISQTEAKGQEIVSRPLSSKTEDSSISGPQVHISKLLNSKTISTSESNVSEHVTRPLASKTLESSRLIADISVKRPIAGEGISQTHLIAQNPQRVINLTSKVLVESNSNVHENIARKLSSQSNGASEAHANGFNTLVNIYGSAITEASARSELMNKQINLYSEVIVQTDLAGTDTYFGNVQKEIGYVETSGQDVINLAPFNYPDQKD